MNVGKSSIVGLRSLFRSFTALCLSASLALPLPLSAQALPVAAEPASQAPVAGVIMEKFKIGGEEIEVTISQIPRDHEADVISSLTEKDPEHTVVLHTGENDPALQKAAKKGFFSRVKNYFAGRPEDTPALSSPELDPTVRDRILKKIKAAVKPVKDHPFGLLFTVVYAGGMAYFNFCETSSIDAASMQFLASTAWAGMLTIYTNGWFNYLRKSQNLGQTLAALTGQEHSQTLTHLWKVGTTFNATLAANALNALNALWQAGTFTGSLYSWGQVALLGAANNSNTIDATIERWEEQGKVSKDFVKYAMPVLETALALLEVATFFHISGALAAAGVITLVGLGYMLGGERLENKISAWRASIRDNHGLIGAIRQRWRQYANHGWCANRLAGMTPPRPPPEPFVSTAILNYPTW
jgi:hypothetical protein